MKIKNLQQLDIFMKTADCGSLSKAARLLGITPAVVSAALKRLETELGVLLLARSTRSLRLTLEGERLLAAARPLLEGLVATELELTSGNAQLHGQLQISMPSDLGRNVLLPWLDQFQALHPAVSLRVQLSDRLADIYRQPVDFAIRYGKPPDSGMVALALAPHNRRVLCAAPSYLAAHGVPASPEQLAGHNCLCLMLADTLFDRWSFTRKDGKRIEIQVRGNRIADDSDAVRRWMLAGLGIGYRAHLDVKEEIAAGHLVELCPDWQTEAAPLYLVCADRRQLSPLARRFRQFLQERIDGLQGSKHD